MRSGDIEDEWADLLDSFGPLHVVQLPGGTQVPARAHTHNTYGTVDMTAANPTIPDPTQGGPAHAIVQSDESASLSPAPVATAETDTRTTKYAYGLSATDTAGWYLGSPEQVTTVVPGGTNIVQQTVYDATTGQMLEVRQPSAAGSSTSPATTAFVYYTAGTNSADAACGNQPAWAGLLCTQGPGGQPSTAGLPGLPVTRITSYDLFGRPLTQTETVTDAAGAQQVRTTTTTYDGPGGIADRVSSVAVTGGVGVNSSSTLNEPGDADLIASPGRGSFGYCCAATASTASARAIKAGASSRTSICCESKAGPSKETSNGSGTRAAYIAPISSQGSDMASLRQLPSGRWQATVKLPGGRRTTKTHTRKVARAWATDIEAKRDRGEQLLDRAAGKTALAAWHSVWRDSRTLTRHTMASYESAWRLHIEPPDPWHTDRGTGQVKGRARPRGQPQCRRRGDTPPGLS